MLIWACFLLDSCRRVLHEPAFWYEGDLFALGSFGNDDGNDRENVTFAQ